MRTAVGKYITQRCSETSPKKGTCHLTAMELYLSEYCHLLKQSKPSSRLRQVLYNIHILIQACFLVAGNNDSTEKKQRGSSFFLLKGTTPKLHRHIHLIIHPLDRKGQVPAITSEHSREQRFATSKIQRGSSMQSGTVRREHQTHCRPSQALLQARCTLGQAPYSVGLYSQAVSVIGLLLDT